MRLHTLAAATACAALSERRFVESLTTAPIALTIPLQYLQLFITTATLAVSELMMSPNGCATPQPLVSSQPVSRLRKSVHEPSVPAVPWHSNAPELIRAISNWLDDGTPKRCFSISIRIAHRSNSALHPACTITVHTPSPTRGSPTLINPPFFPTQSPMVLHG